MPILEIQLPLKASIKRIKDKFDTGSQISFTVADLKKITEKLKSKADKDDKADKPDASLPVSSNLAPILPLLPLLTLLPVPLPFFPIIPDSSSVEITEKEEDEEDEALSLTLLPASSYHIPLARVTLDAKNYHSGLNATKAAIAEVTKDLLEFSVVAKDDPELLYFSFPYGTTFGPARFYIRPEKVLENLITQLCLALAKKNLKFAPCVPHITIAILDKNCDRSRSIVTQYYKGISTLIYETATEIVLKEGKKKLATFSLKSESPTPAKLLTPSYSSTVHSQSVAPIAALIIPQKAAPDGIQKLTDECRAINESLQASIPDHRPPPLTFIPV